MFKVPSIILLVLSACGEHGNRPEPQFTLVAQDRLGRILIEENSSNYQTALQNAPYLVVVEEGETSEEVEIPIDYCERLTKLCTGPLTLQSLTLTLDPFFDEHVAASNCVGLDGSVGTGIDVSKTGACR